MNQITLHCQQNKRITFHHLDKHLSVISSQANTMKHIGMFPKFWPYVPTQKTSWLLRYRVMYYMLLCA